MSKKRILWLMNYTSLRDFEVPLLLEAGYEVFTPKVLPFGFGNENASVTWEYDNSLTLFPEELERLNQMDLYHMISGEGWELINRVFDLIFLDLYPYVLKGVVENFSGTIVLRSSTLPGGVTCTEWIAQSLGLGFISKLERLGTRFWFAPVLQKMGNAEYRVLHSRYIKLPFVPVGIPDGTASSPATQLSCIVCPQIRMNPAAEAAYSEIKKIFKNMAYQIGGAQYIAIPNDPKVLPMSTADGRIEHPQDYIGMYLCDQESSVFDSYAYDAIGQGCPVVYWKGGAFDALINDRTKPKSTDFPGACLSHEDAKRMLDRLRKNAAYRSELVGKQQARLSELLDLKKSQREWHEGMSRINEARSSGGVDQKKQNVKLAVIIPQAYTGGVMDYSERLIKCIRRGAEELGDHVEVLLGILDNPIYEEGGLLSGVKKANIPIRKFQWTEKDERWARDASILKGIPCPPSPNGRYFILNDGNTNFEDCDYILFTADRSPGTIFTSVPYSVTAHDFIQRYVPEITSPEIELMFYDMQRSSDTVFVTTPVNYVDAVQCGGNAKEKVVLTPLLLDLVKLPEKVPSSRKEKKRGDYFLWATNPALHKNHVRAIYALIDYYSKGGTLKCFMTGGNTKWFDPKVKCDVDYPSVLKIRQIIAENSVLKKKLIILGNLTKDIYLPLLHDAKFVFHPGYADNGNGTVIDAACFGVPALSSDYPAMRYIDERFHIQTHFFSPFDEEEMTQALLSAERDHEMYALALPSRDALQKMTTSYTYRETYEHIKRVAMI